ncbi:MAG: hypothetical protein MUE41_12300 [Gemmatimonadaceae bacterium]|nr:hypothetical protein [Gemmatimonadaceae bacterium]
MVPAFIDNLRVPVGGEWAALPIDERELIDRALRVPGRLERWRRVRTARSMAVEWDAVMALHDRLREAPAERRAALAQAWDLFTRPFLEPTLERCLGLDGLCARLVENGMSRAACDATAHADFLPIYRTLLVGDERAEQSAREANVRAFIARAFSAPESGAPAP